MSKTKSKQRKEKQKRKILEDYKKIQELSKSHNPLPKRNQKPIKLRSTIESHSNFINCAQKYFNMGKYKGVSLNYVPVSYMKWVTDTIQLNDSELRLIRKYIKLKEKKWKN